MTAGRSQRSNATSTQAPPHAAARTGRSAVAALSVSCLVGYCLDGHFMRSRGRACNQMVPSHVATAKTKSKLSRDVVMLNEVGDASYGGT